MKSLLHYTTLLFLLSTAVLFSQNAEVGLIGGDLLLQDELSALETKEWKKLKFFKSQLDDSKISQDQKNLELRNYAKDSLKILRVKLVAVKILDSKKLLEQDIAENKDYYLAFLEKLKKSDLKRSEYLFLENKLAFLTTEFVENKYATSKVVIAILVFFVLTLLFFVFKSSRKKIGDQVHLSPQEINVQQLILGGKTNKEIANELFISLSTVKTHITNIYSKLKVSSRQELQRKMQN